MSTRPGPLNAITDIAGLRVGNAQDDTVVTGTTVVLPPPGGGAASVDVRGGGPGTRETDLLDPQATVETMHALVLSGGSAFGLDAAGAVQAWLAERGEGFAVGPARVPIVPAAILFDLSIGAPWTGEAPYRRLGRAAAEAALAGGTDFALGNAGAGYGANTATVKGGLGTASFVDSETGTTVGALAAVNAMGSPVMDDGCFWAWPFEWAGEFGGRRPDPGAAPQSPGGATKTHDTQPGRNTTIAVVATDATLAKADLKRLAIMAQDGLARAIRPAHSPLDGDTVFALSTRAGPAPDAVGLARLGALAADCLARAIARGVYEADTLAGRPGWRRRYG